MEKRSGLPREVWKWLLALDLPRPGEFQLFLTSRKKCFLNICFNVILVTNVRRDFQSGENIAFILHSYYDKSQEPAGLIDLKQLNNGASFRQSHKI